MQKNVKNLRGVSGSRNGRSTPCTASAFWRVRINPLWQKKSRLLSQKRFTLDGAERNRGTEPLQLYKIHKNIKGNIDKFSVDRIIAIVINL